MPMTAPMHRIAPALFMALALLPARPAFANEFCDKELGPMMTETKELTGKLEAISKRSKSPNAREQFCGTLNAYIGNIRKVLAYMEQNKDFCAVPDAAIDNAKKGLAQNQAMRRKVCLAQAQPPAQQQGAQQPGAGQKVIPRPPVELKLQ
jgi:hypothetical protein